jgi:hypothetical protein
MMSSEHRPPQRILKGLLCVALLAAAAGPLGAGDRYSVECESGLIWSGYNDIRIPGRGGTLLSFSEDLSTDPAPFVRLRLTRRLGSRHHLGLLIAPLRLSASGAVDRQVVFEGATFPPRTALSGSYRFDSYRLTYRYDFRRSEGLELGVGLTLKVRDAEVGLSSVAATAAKKNTGPVPLLHARGRVALGARTSLLVELDAAAAPQGRAEDLLVAVERSVGSRWALRVGYRLLEGGADNDEVYTFAWLNYAVVGLALRF